MKEETDQQTFKEAGHETIGKECPGLEDTVSVMAWGRSVPGVSSSREKASVEVSEQEEKLDTRSKT